MKMILYSGPYLVFILMCIAAHGLGSSQVEDTHADKSKKIPKGEADAISTSLKSTDMKKASANRNSENNSSKTTIEHKAPQTQAQETSSPANKSGSSSYATTVVSSTSTEVTTQIPVVFQNPITRNFSTGAVVRGFYVFVGLGAVVVMYIVVRTVRLRRKKTTVRKYGVVANWEDVEMAPLGQEDEEEESTLFDMTKPRT